MSKNVTSYRFDTTNIIKFILDVSDSYEASITEKAISVL